MCLETILPTEFCEGIAGKLARLRQCKGMSIVNREREAKSRIVAEWHIWAEGKGRLSSQEAIQFFEHLQREKPDLLALLASGRKWRVVHKFLSDSGLLS